MDDPTWIPRVAVRAAHFEQLREHGGLQGIRDPNGLEAALARPINKNSYAPDSDVSDLAAAYAFGLVRGHCFADGNKRTGLAVALMFLDLNGFELSPDVNENEVVEVVLALAADDIDEPEFARWLRERLVHT